MESLKSTRQLSAPQDSLWNVTWRHVFGIGFPLPKRSGPQYNPQPIFVFSLKTPKTHFVTVCSFLSHVFLHVNTIILKGNRVEQSVNTATVEHSPFNQWSYLLRESNSFWFGLTKWFRDSFTTWHNCHHVMLVIPAIIQNYFIKCVCALIKQSHNQLNINISNIYIYSTHTCRLYIIYTQFSIFKLIV